jgi:hypothetical protein
VSVVQIAQAVSQIGTDVVIAQIRNGQLANETLFNETFASQAIATDAPRQHPGWQVFDRYQYRTLARNHCGVTVLTDRLLSRFYDNAFIVPVPGSTPRVGVVELKVVDEGRRWNAPSDSIATDYDKIRAFQALLRAQGSPIVIEGYVGGLVCDTYSPPYKASAEDIITELTQAYPGLMVEPGTRVRSIQGTWGWRFICAKMLALPCPHISTRIAVPDCIQKSPFSTGV